MNRSCTTLAALALTLATAIPLLAADDGALPTDTIRQGEAKQQQIKSQTQQVAGQLQGIIDEFRRNGMDGQDVQVLDGIRQILSRLSDQEMKRVISALQDARATADTTNSRKSLTGAVREQKNIVVQMRQLLLEYQRQQALYDLALRLSALSGRQDGAMKITVDMAKAAGKNGNNADENRRTLQQADQEALKNEINPLLAKLETLSRDGDDLTRNRLTKAMDASRTGGLKPALDQAVDDFKSQPPNLFRAATDQKTIRDQLRDLARLVAPPKDTFAALEQAAKELQVAIDAQKQVIDQTKKADRKPESLRALEPNQADVVDKTDQLRKDLVKLAPQSASSLKDSTDQMQEARADLQENRRDKALEKEQAALAKLDQAQKDLQEQLAKAEPTATPQDKLAAAHQLQEQTRQLIKKQEELKTRTALSQNKPKDLKNLATPQQNLEEATRQLQKQTAAQSDKAAQAMDQAALQMDKAEKNLTRGNEAQRTQEAQADAIAALKQADQQLENQIAQLDAAAKELAAATDARDQITKLVVRQEKVELDTAKTAASVDPAARPTTRPATPQQLASQEAQLANDTQSVRNSLPEGEKSAATPLDEARRNMADAKNRLDANQPNNANPPQQEAVANLLRARDALDKRIDELQKDLGQPQANPDLATATEKLQQLQKDVQAATDQMDPNAARKSVEDQQREVANRLGQLSQNQPDSQPLADARKAADQAASQLAQNNLPQAIKSMDQTQKGMQEAQAQQAQQPPQEQQNQQAQGQPQSQQGQQAQQSQAGQQSQQAQGQQQSQQGQQAQAQQQNQQGQQPQQGQQNQPAQPPSGQASLPQLAARQMDLKKAVEQMAAAQKAGADPQASAMQQASKALDGAAQEAGKMAAGQPTSLPPSANNAMQQATQSLINAAAAASASDANTAQSAAAEAQSALSQAAAALSLAQAGMSGQLANAQNPSSPTPGQQGQQKQTAQQGKQGQQGQTPGQDPASQKEGQNGQPKDPNGQSASAQNSNQPDKSDSTSGQSSGNRQASNGNSNMSGPRRQETSAGKFMALPERDRKALLQSQSDKYPQEYGAQIEQYLKNLSDTEAK